MPEEPYSMLKKFTFDKWVRLYDKFIDDPRKRHGRVTGTGLHRPGRLRAVVGGFQAMVDAQYDPFLMSAMVIKDIVGEPLSAGKKPLIFADGNRRMSLIYARYILRHFGRDIPLDTPKALKFKENVRFIDIHKIERWLRTYSIAINTPLSSRSLNISSDVRSNQTSYSSSVIGGTYGSSDINTLLQAGYQLHAEGVSMEDIENWRVLAINWDVEARPSRIVGRFDMFIKRRL